ncbi:MAG TPA: RNA polymerase sigma factor SigJ [Actinoplanes sp.]|nr:RNA polymerase sigma factor SigJ [Actinoplanes sp.]
MTGRRDRPPSCDGTEFDVDRRYLFAVAYRLVGSAADAEDAVQEAYLRLRTSAPPDLADRRAWLTTVVSRLCLDLLRSAHRRRETYVGTWLPEPLVGYDDTDLADAAALRESVRTAVLLVMETLTPAERVAFVLHDVFGMDYDRLAAVVGRSTTACRQLASRARRRVRQDAPPRGEIDDAVQAQVVDAFLRAGVDGDLRDLVRLLDPDVVLRSDGGGEVRAALHTVRGAKNVAALLAGLRRRAMHAVGQPARLASGGGFLLYDEGTLIGILGFDTAGGRITEFNLVLAPTKLRHRRGAISSAEG